jgi:iron complex transport system substrate-binding protein
VGGDDRRRPGRRSLLGDPELGDADRYPADLILYDARATAPTFEKLDEIAAWKRLPAVRAGQVSPWRMEEGVSYRLFASHVEELTAKIRDSRGLSA